MELEKLYDKIVEVGIETAHISEKVSGMADRIDNVERDVNKISSDLTKTAENDAGFWRKTFIGLIISLLLAGGAGSILTKMSYANAAKQIENSAGTNAK